jgi:hypothetical protein
MKRTLLEIVQDGDTVLFRTENLASPGEYNETRHPDLAHALATLYEAMTRTYLQEMMLQKIEEAEKN